MKVTGPFKESMIGKRVVKVGSNSDTRDGYVGTIVLRWPYSSHDNYVVIRWDGPRKLRTLTGVSFDNLEYFDLDQLRAEMWGFLELAARGIEERKHG